MKKNVTINFEKYVENVYENSGIPEFCVEIISEGSIYDINVYIEAVWAVKNGQKLYKITDQNLIDEIEANLDLESLAQKEYIEYMAGYMDYLYEEAKDRRLEL